MAKPVIRGTRGTAASRPTCLRRPSTPTSSCRRTMATPVPLDAVRSAGARARASALLVVALATGPLLAPPVGAQPLLVELVSLTSPVNLGKPATIVVQTLGGASCRITVSYKGGPSRARTLVPKRADAQGRVVWKWVVDSKTVPGRWPIVVTCSARGREGTLAASFVVEVMPAFR